MTDFPPHHQVVSRGLLPGALRCLLYLSVPNVRGTYRTALPKAVPAPRHQNQGCNYFREPHPQNRTLSKIVFCS